MSIEQHDVDQPQPHRDMILTSFVQERVAYIACFPVLLTIRPPGQDRMLADGLVVGNPPVNRKVMGSNNTRSRTFWLHSFLASILFDCSS